jgi:PhoH-like ATPase
VVIPLAVIEEIDNQKKRQDEIGRNARITSRFLDELRSGESFPKGFPFKRGEPFEWN